MDGTLCTAVAPYTVLVVALGHGPGARYQRPYAVPESLDLLRGPFSVAVRLPSYLDWSGNAVCDLDAPGRVVDFYRAVLIAHLCGKQVSRASVAPFIDRVIEGGPGGVTAPHDPLNVRDYLDLMLAGSFPEPSLRIPVTARRRWFAGYVEQMITRDVPAVPPRRDPELLRRYLSVLAVNTAGIAAESTLWTAAGINAKTAHAYHLIQL